MNKTDLEKILVLYDEGTSASKIASLLEYSYPTIRKHIIRHRGTLRPHHKYRKYDINVQLFSNSPIGHYWAGFIAADGCLRPRQLTFMISNRDRQHLELLAQDLNCPISIVRTRWTTAPKKDGSRYGSFKSAVAAFSSKELIKILNDYGIRDFKNGKPISYNRDFLRGFFDGDGSVYVKNHPRNINKFMLYSPHKLILHSIGDWLKQEKLITRYSVFKNRKIFQLHVGNKSDFNTLYNYIYTDATRFLQRKKNKWKMLSE